MIEDTVGLVDEVCNQLRLATDIAVVGLSGGADSTLVAILCAKALGKENVYGVHMPYNLFDMETFNSRSVKLADHIKINQKVVNIGTSVNLLVANVMRGGTQLSQLNEGNMRSRMRMIALYTVCCHVSEQIGKRVRVIGTGNLSEDFIGYDTKGGDALADIFPIGSLVKSEVYQLLDYFIDQGIILKDMVDRVPSAGLWNGQTDEEELGYSYNQMEPYVLAMSKHGQVDFDDPISAFVYKRHKDNKHKHEAPPIIDLRMFCDEGMDKR